MTRAADAAWAEAASRELVPWVGAGVPTGMRRVGSTKPLIPDWTTFLRDATRKLSEQDQQAVLEMIGAERLEDAAAALRRGLKAGWTTLLTDTFDVRPLDAIEEDGEVLKAIWRVSNGLVITTNYDPTLRWVHMEGAAPVQSYGLHAAPDLGTLLRLDPGRPVLWQLHGSIEHPQTIVIRRTEYDRLYGASEHALGNEPVERDQILDATYLSLRALVATRNLLFIGTSLKDQRVRDVLLNSHLLFQAARTRHFMVCLENELDAVNELLEDSGLDEFITLLPIESYGKDLLSRLKSLSPDTTQLSAMDIADPKWVRRRCRAVVAGGAEFIERLRPLVGEAAPNVAVEELRDMYDEPGLTSFQRAMVLALRYEFETKMPQMVNCTSAALQGGDLKPEERLNLLLIHAIGLEKRKGDEDLPNAIRALDEILASKDVNPELRMCAEFNRDVCREKLDDSDVSFARYIEQRDYVFSSGELLWPKAWNMEVIRCFRQGQPFEYADLFDDVIAAEINEGSIGVGKSIANWGHFAGRGSIDPKLVESLNDYARDATPATRMTFLVYLASETNEPRFREAVDKALEKVGNNATVRDMVQTRRVHGRYTLYGEFLMHARTWGYVAPTPMYLWGTRGETHGKTIWNPEVDETLRLVKQLGLNPLSAVEGDLPFGQGFASSTVLAILHIGHQLAPVVRRQVVNMLDWLSHGFEPSGLDHDAITAEVPGLYKQGAWLVAEPLKIHGLFVRSAEPARITLKETQARVERVAGPLVDVADRLTTRIRDDAVLDMDAFAEYCARLSKAGVYTDEQLHVYEESAARGLASKAIGGLQAKAMLVVGDPTELDSYALALGDRVIGRLTQGA